MHCVWPWFYIALLLDSIGATDILFPGLDPRDTYLPPTDDAFAGPISLPSAMQLFGTYWGQCYVDNNGVVSFHYWATAFTPDTLIHNSSIPMLAIWFADVDTRANLTDANQVSYRIADAADLAQIHDYLGIPNLQYGFIATWFKVGYYNHSDDKLNTFQMVLAWAGSSTYVCYFYEKLAWTTGDASGGSDGLGGMPALAGFSDGQGSAYTLPGSGTSNVLQLSHLSGGTLIPRRGPSPGVWCFDVSSQCALTCPSDENPCTVDTCDQTGACQHTPVAAGTVCAMNARCNAHSACECQAGSHSSNPIMGCSSNALAMNSTLAQGQSLSNGAWSAVMQSDGNFVLYGAGTSKWASNTQGQGKGPYRLVLQSDGNLVLYDSLDHPLWNTHTYGHGQPPFRLVLQDDHNLVLYDGTGKPLWSTGTGR